MANEVEAKLAALGLTLPQPAAPAANYVPWTLANGIVYVAGQLPFKDGKLVVTETCDGGHSFRTQDRGLPEGPCYDLIYRHALVIDRTGERLAIGSTTGNLWASSDGGAGWHLLSAHLPPIAALAFAP